MSTLSQPHLEPAWKQEINRRLAEHKSRKGGTAAAHPGDEQGKPGNSRAAEAAARVAARYAKAPTYSDMQAEEARVAVRAAEIATQVARQAQRTAESALAELHAAAEQPMRKPAVVESITRTVPTETAPVGSDHPPVVNGALASAAGNSALQNDSLREEPRSSTASMPPVVTTNERVDSRAFDLRWEPDLPHRAIPMPPAARVQEEFELAEEDWWTPAEVSATLRSEPIAVDGQQTHANLIEFPRELVAPRKMRPRLAEQLADPESQLSIFEVDPAPAEAQTVHEHAASAPASWTAPDWSGIKLDAHPVSAHAPSEPQTQQGPYLAPLGLRLMASVVDGALSLALFFLAVLWISSSMSSVPSGKSAELLGASGLVIAGLLYQALFCFMGKSTLGMRYAGIALCTFDDDMPNSAQLRRRLGALVVSLMPVGLGLVWAVFDDDHLSWHDRYSGTYLRKR